MPIHLDHTILEVEDLAESVAFYRDVLACNTAAPADLSR